MSKADTRELESLGMTVSERDREILLRLGKKPVLKRNFGFISIFSFASTILIAWETTLMTIQYGLENGGSGGLVYQFIYIWLGVMLTFVVVSELVSMAPVSGGQYHWVSMLAPTRIHSFLSYITGWLTICGWQGTTAAGVYYSSTMLQGIGTLVNPDYTAEPWHQILIAIGLLAFAILINTRGGQVLPRFEGFMLILHILGFFAILIPIVVLSEKQSADEVFKTFMNGGNQPTQGLSFMVGTTGLLLTFSGADGAIHMAEEIQNAEIVVPRAITLAYLLNGVLAFAMLIATLFAIEDVERALDSPTNYPYMEIFRQATGSIPGSAIMIAVITVMEICQLTSSLATSSRMLWSFARDRGMPGWQVFSKIEKKTSVPVNAVILLSSIAFALQFINFGSSTVFEDLTSISVAGLYSSYLIAVSLLLWRRCSGRINFTALSHKPSHSTSLGSGSGSDTRQSYEKRGITLTNTANAPLTWGPWHVPGIFGIVLNAFVVCFVFVAWLFSFFPTTLPVDPTNMNYNCVLWGGVVILSLLYYAVQGHKEYSGPIIDPEAFQSASESDVARS